MYATQQTAVAALTDRIDSIDSYVLDSMDFANAPAQQTQRTERLDLTQLLRHTWHCRAGQASAEAHLP